MPCKITTATCHHCGVEFRRQAATVKQRDAAIRFCSNQCSQAARSKTIGQPCQQCGATFYRAPSQFGPYCSINCAVQSREAARDRNPELRFWPKVEKSDGCWTWTGAITGSGYGNFWDGARYRPAHIVAYELLIGPVPAGLELDHLCRNTACVNPAHLEPVTGAENQQRGHAFRRAHGIPDPRLRQP